jgi:hypothetical protein
MIKRKQNETIISDSSREQMKPGVFSVYAKNTLKTCVFRDRNKKKGNKIRKCVLRQAVLHWKFCPWTEQQITL